MTPIQDFLFPPPCILTCARLQRVGMASDSAVTGKSADDGYRKELVARGFDADEVDDLLLDIPSFSSDDEADEGHPAVDTPQVVDQRPLRERYAQSLELMAVHAPHHRSEDDGFAASGRSLLEQLLSDPPDHLRLRYCPCAELKEADFMKKFVEGDGLPVMITGLAQKWRAQERWSSAEQLIAHYGAVPVKVWNIASVSGFGKPMPVHLPIELYCE